MLATHQCKGAGRFVNCLRGCGPGETVNGGKAHITPLRAWKKRPIERSRHPISPDRELGTVPILGTSEAGRTKMSDRILCRIP